MVDSVSTNGGYVWYYLPDLSRRWGEMEAYKTMIWVQNGGTVSVGHLLLDAFHATGNTYFYQAAGKAADAMIKGQSKAGGWNYMIDFAGEASLKKWYATIGKNGWRLEEFQHYYGNDTYDDDVTSNAARFLLRMYLAKGDLKYKNALDKAINFMLKSQYANGGWPQRFPLKYNFKKAGHEDYTSFYTFNDDVIWENINFLLQCYQTLGEKKLLDPIQKGMHFYVISQDANGAWGQQYDTSMVVAGARTYEPAAYLPRTTFGNAMLLLKFYQFTGDKKYLSGVPVAITWLENSKLPEKKSTDRRYTHPLYVSTQTGKPVYVHRRGANVKYGQYFTDTSDANLLSHMYGKSRIDIQILKDEYERSLKLLPDVLSAQSPLNFSGKENKDIPPVLSYLNFKEMPDSIGSSEETIKNIIGALDEKNRWLAKYVMISHPYIGDGKDPSQTDVFASVHVGDSTDTSPYRDTTEQEYISTPVYIRNMTILSNYLNDIKARKIN